MERVPSAATGETACFIRCFVPPIRLHTALRYRTLPRIIQSLPNF